MRPGATEGKDRRNDLLNLTAGMMVLAIPREVIWSYTVGGIVFVLGLAIIFLRGDRQKAQGLDKLFCSDGFFRRAASGVRHRTFHAGAGGGVDRTAVDSVAPVLAYFVGACFIAAGFAW